MDADIAALVSRQRIREAAELAASRGQHGVASDLFERACEFRAAAEAAIAGEDWARAVGLAVIARDDAVAERALVALATLAGRLAALGPPQAQADAERELAALGGPRESVAPVPANEIQRRIYGRYEVVREVASTATSRVLECTDTVRGEHVAVKIFAA